MKPQRKKFKKKFWAVLWDAYPYQIRLFKEKEIAGLDIMVFGAVKGNKRIARVEVKEI